MFWRCLQQLVARTKGVSRGTAVVGKLVHSRHEQMSPKSHLLISDKSATQVKFTGGVTGRGNVCLLLLGQNKMERFSLLPWKYSPSGEVDPVSDSFCVSSATYVRKIL